MVVTARGAENKRRRYPRNIVPESVSALISTLKAHDASAKDGHLERTGMLVAEVATRLNLGPRERWVAWQAAILHDIGKVTVPSSILDKLGTLNDHEWEIVRRHPEAGADMLSGIAGYDGVARVVLAHHERFDGLGYPRGLSGEEIPIAARLICVVDAYDAMTNHRPYRKLLTHGEAIVELEAGAGSQFDLSVVEAVKTVLDKGGLG